MKRFLSVVSMFALALAVGVVSAPKAQGDFLDVGSSITAAQKRMEEQLAGIDEAIRAAFEAGSFISTVKSISLNTTGGYACEGTAVKNTTTRGFLVTAANDRKVIVTAANEDVLKRTYAAVTSAQLAGLSVSFIGTSSTCANVSNVVELTITK